MEIVAKWKKNLDFGRSLDIITQMIRRVVWLVYGSDGGDQLSDFWRDEKHPLEVVL